MLEMNTKWMSNTLAKASMLNKEGILCESGNLLFIIGYGVLTSSGKNTYNFEVRDNDNNVIENGNDAYLDKLTTIIKGASPKVKVSKSASDNNSKSKAKSKSCNDMVIEFRRLEDNLRKAIISFNDFKVSNNVATLNDVIIAQTKAKQAKREAKQNERREEVAILRRIASLRKWAKDTKRLDLLQALNEKLLSM